MPRKIQHPPRVVVVVFAGPNGAGKSTHADAILAALGIDNFVKADYIARGLSQESWPAAIRIHEQNLRFCPSWPAPNRPNLPPRWEPARTPRHRHRQQGTHRKELE